MSAPPRLVSVVCPVFDEADGLVAFYERLVAAVDGTDRSLYVFEFLLVDDGSRDRSVEVARQLCTRDPRVRLLVLSRNFGHQIAVTAGIDHAHGDAVIVIDSDLQDPPEVIAEMLELWAGGAKVVYGVRLARAGESRFKVLTARAFYRLLARLADTPMPLDAGDFRLMDASVVRTLRSMREENRYLRGLVSWVGFRQVPVAYRRDPRHAGESGYRLITMMRLALDGITSFSDRPLALASRVGALVTLGSFGYSVALFLLKVLAPSRQLPGYASLMIVVLLLGGIQLLSIGLLGEYVGRIHREVKGRPLYVLDPDDLFGAEPQDRGGGPPTQSA